MPGGTPGRPALDDLLDTVGALLRDYGKDAFDLPELDGRAARTLFTAWAQHALSGTPAPGSPENREALALEQRKWNELRVGFADHRRKETTYVGKTLEDFREVIFAFLANLNGLAAEDAVTERKVAEQLGQLQTAVRGNASEEIKRVAFQTLETVNLAFEQRRKRQEAEAGELAARLSQLGAQLETARQENAIDALTTLFNRRAFDEHVGRTVELCRLLRESAVLVMIDGDHFKQVNDRYGHPGGDAVLRSLSQTIVRTFRRKHDFVARYGGEEFVVVARDLDPPAARALCERLLKAVRAAAVAHGDQAIRITVSVGLAVLEKDENEASWISRADQALYEAKQQGRDRMAER